MTRPVRPLAILAVTAACAGGPAPRATAPAAAPPDSCIVAGSRSRFDSATVVLHTPPESEAIPQSGAEWFVAAQSVTPLVRVDCAGNWHPALAASWQRVGDGRIWTFAIRAGAALPDGTPALAAAIVADWRRPAAAARLALAEVTDVTAKDPELLQVTFAAPTDSAPARLADPVLAPGLERPDPWHLASAAHLTVLPTPADLRDAVDGQTDFIITADPATLAYARDRPGLVTVPLPWSRTYVFASPRPFPTARDERFRASLAQDVVPADARVAVPAVWWDVACPPAPARPAGSPAQNGRLAYPAGDTIAAAIAGRLVALGAAGSRGTTQALPLNQLRSVLQQGEPLPAVLPVSRFDPAPCSVRSLAVAGWFVAPLVDTRAQLIARRDGPPVERDGFGLLRIALPETAAR
jgi:hypothetical protein